MEKCPLANSSPLSPAAQAAINEFRYQAGKYCAEPCAGTRYALGMAAEECLLLGIDPSSITPTGYALATELRQEGQS
jgi:hypothetical protein